MAKNQKNAEPRYAVEEVEQILEFAAQSHEKDAAESEAKGRREAARYHRQMADGTFREVKRLFAGWAKRWEFEQRIKKDQAAARKGVGE